MNVKLRPDFHIVGFGPLRLNEYDLYGKLNRQFRFKSVEETISFACSSGLNLRPTWQGYADYAPIGDTWINQGIEGVTDPKDGDE
jgi:hypothetical protein